MHATGSDQTVLKLQMQVATTAAAGAAETAARGDLQLVTSE